VHDYVNQVKQSVENVTDPRVQGRVTHLLLNIVAISLLAVLSGFGTEKTWKCTARNAGNG
jgi:hypothetical protein